MDKEAMRKAFEEADSKEWAIPEDHYARWFREDGHYDDWPVETRWRTWQAAMAHSEAAIVEAIARQWDGCMAPMFDSAGNLTGPIDIGETIRADATLSRQA